MITPVLLLAAIVNIVGLLNNYNIKEHPLDIRVRRDVAEDRENEPQTSTSSDKLYSLNRASDQDIFKQEDIEEAKQDTANTDMFDTSDIIVSTSEKDPISNLYKDITSLNNYNELLTEEIERQSEHPNSSPEDIKKNISDSEIYDYLNLLNEINEELSKELNVNPTVESENIVIAKKENEDDERKERLKIHNNTAVDIVMLLNNEILSTDELADRRNESLLTNTNTKAEEIMDQKEEFTNKGENDKAEEVLTDDYDTLKTKQTNRLLDIIFNLRDGIDVDLKDRSKRNASYNDYYSRRIYSSSIPLNNFTSIRNGLDPRYSTNYNSVYTRNNGTASNFRMNQYIQPYSSNYNLPPNNISYNSRNTNMYRIFNNGYNFTNNYPNNNRYNHTNTLYYNPNINPNNIPNNGYVNNFNNNYSINNGMNNPYNTLNSNTLPYNVNTNSPNYRIDPNKNVDNKNNFYNNYSINNFPNKPFNNGINNNNPPYNTNYANDRGNFNKMDGNKNNLFNNYHSMNKPLNNSYNYINNPNNAYSNLPNRNVNQNDGKNNFYNNNYSINNYGNKYPYNNPLYMAPTNTAVYNTVQTVIETTTSAPVIVEGCFLCGSVGCPQFFRRIGFLCVPLDEN